jgi:hypothetical protein
LADINRRLTGKAGYFISILRYKLLDIDFSIGGGADGPQAVGRGGDVILAAGVMSTFSALRFHPVIQIHRLSGIKRIVR